MSGKIMQDLALKLSADSAELKRGVADANKSLKSIETNSKQIGQQVTKAFGVVAAAIGVAVTAFKAAESSIKSTQATGDALDQTLGAIKESTNILKQSLATMDFSNLIDRMKDAVDVGKEYVAMLDEIADRNRALSVGAADLRLQMAKQRGIILDPNSTAEEKAAALAEERRLNEEYTNRLVATRQMTYDNELKRLRELHNLSEEQVKALETYIEKYDVLSDVELKRVAQFEAAQKEEERLRREALGYGRGTEKSIEAIEAYKKQQEVVKNLRGDLSELELSYVSLGNTINKLTDDERDRLAQARIGIIEARTTAQENINKFYRDEERVNRAGGGTTKVEKEVVGELNNLYKQLGEAREAFLTAATHSERVLANIQIEELEKDIQKIEERIAIANTQVNKMSAIGLRVEAPNLQLEMRELSTEAQTYFDTPIEIKFTGMDAFKEALQESYDTMNLIYTLTDGLNAAFNSLFSDGVGGLKDFITYLLRAVQGLLAMAIAEMIASESRKGLSGLVTAAIGVAGITALWQSKVPQFADGALVYGETLATVGEYGGARSNPEVIAPLDKLKGILADSMGGSMSGEVRFVIEGDKLVGILNNYNNKQIYF